MAKVELTPEQKKERQRLFVRMLGLAYMIQLETSYCVFIDYSGHVDTLEVDIRESKKNWQQKVASCNIYTSEKYEEFQKSGEDPNFWVKEKVRILEEILESGEVDTSGMREEVETICHHYF